MKISEIFESLHNVGMSEVMLYLPDGSASRCHWRDTALLHGVRVALVADVDRGIVRIVPLDGCEGIGFPSPKGVDPMGYKAVIGTKLNEVFGAGSIPPAPVDAVVEVAGEAPVPEEGVADPPAPVGLNGIHRDGAGSAEEEPEAPMAPQAVARPIPKAITMPNGETVPAANAGELARALLARLNAANLGGRTPPTPRP